MRGGACFHRVSQRVAWMSTVKLRVSKQKANIALHGEEEPEFHESKVPIDHF